MEANGAFERARQDPRVTPTRWLVERLVSPRVIPCSSSRASVLNHSGGHAVLHRTAQRKCLLTTPSLLSKGALKTFSCAGVGAPAKGPTFANDAKMGHPHVLQAEHARSWVTFSLTWATRPRKPIRQQQIQNQRRVALIGLLLAHGAGSNLRRVPDPQLLAQLR